MAARQSKRIAFEPRINGEPQGLITYIASPALDLLLDCTHLSMGSSGGESEVKRRECLTKTKQELRGRERGGGGYQRYEAKISLRGKGAFSGLLDTRKENGQKKPEKRGTR